MKRILFALLLALSPTAAFAQAGTAGISPCAAETLAVSNTSANVQLSTCGPVVILYNITSTEAFYNYGTASTTAATTSNLSLPGNTFVTLNIGSVGAGTAGFLAAITTSSTTTIRIVQGYAE